jgi:hypothetical protein
MFFRDEKGNMLRKYVRQYAEHFGMNKKPGIVSTSQSGWDDQHRLAFEDTSNWGAAKAIAKAVFKTCKVDKVEIVARFRLWATHGMGTGYYEYLTPAGKYKHFERWYDAPNFIDPAEQNHDPFKDNENIVPTGKPGPLPPEYAGDEVFITERVEWVRQEATYKMSSSSSGYRAPKLPDVEFSSD